MSPGFTYLAILAALFLITAILFGIGMDDKDDLDFNNHPIASSLGIFSCIVLAIGTVIGGLWFASWILSPSPTPSQYKTEYAVKEQPKNKAEVVKVVNDAIKETNRKIDENQWLLENKKTKLTVKAEIEEGSNIKEAKLEFVVDSVTDKDIDFAHNAITGIVNQIKE
jgi:hypothetical protein